MSEETNTQPLKSSDTAAEPSLAPDASNAPAIQESSESAPLAVDSSTAPAASVEPAQSDMPTPVPAEAPVTSSPPSNPAPSAVVSLPVAPAKGLGQFLAKLKAKLTGRTQKRLDKILAYARKNGNVTNDEAQKLVYVSDATATRYLFKLVKQGKLKPAGSTKNVKYLPSQ